MKRLLVAALAFVAAGAAGAQVGYDPQHSPYRDLDANHEWAFMFGHFTSRPDPAGVTPQGGSTAGVYYGWHASGPLYLTTDLTRIASQRVVLDPSVPAASRVLGTAVWPLYSLDGDLAVAFPGARTFHGLQPLAKIGVGLISDRHSRSDVGDFSFGTRFEFNWGVSLRYVATERWGLRADLCERFYQMGYPETYYAKASDSTSVVVSTQGKSFWRINPSFSIGLSYMPWR